MEGVQNSKVFKLVTFDCDLDQLGGMVGVIGSAHRLTDAKILLVTFDCELDLSGAWLE